MKNHRSYINSAYHLFKFSGIPAFLKLIFLIFLLSSQVLLSQSENIISYQYISPIPGSSYISPESNIIIRYGSILENPVLNTNLINVIGRKSGFHSGQLKIYDVLGNEIATLVNEEKHTGEYEVEFNGTTLPSGIYFYNIQAAEFVETKKMVLLK